MFNIATRKSLLLSLIDFCVSFGANTDRIMHSIDEVNSALSEARPQYLELRFDEVLETCREVDQMLGRIEQHAMKLKDMALFWVYLIEWLVVFSVSLLTGFGIWTLMIRRKLYKEVKVTRLVTTE